MERNYTFLSLRVIKMNSFNKQSLDRYITGNYGEDQFEQNDQTQSLIDGLNQFLENCAHNMTENECAEIEKTIDFLTEWTRA
jgi:hypothetical protein